MKNIHVLSTNKPSRLHYSKIKNNDKISYKLVLKKEFSKCNDGLLSGQRHIYITSDEEIKELDKSLLILEEFEPMILTHYEPVEEGYIGKKIIITTDQDLIKDGVQAIDDEFLEWFVKNPNCEEIEVVDVRSLGVYGSYYPYKINIPKEEPKQETLEEIVIKNFNEEYIKIDLYDSNDNFIGKLDRNQYIDVRIQAYMKNIKGLYVVYPDGEKGFINHENGAVSYFQEGLWDTALRLSRYLMSLQSNDIKNQNRIIE